MTDEQAVEVIAVLGRIESKLDAMIVAEEAQSALIMDHEERIQRIEVVG